MVISLDHELAVRSRKLPWVVLLAMAVAPMCLTAPVAGQTEAEDAQRRGLRFIGVKYGSVVDQGGWTDDALAWKKSAPNETQDVVVGVEASGSFGVEGLWQFGSRASGIQLSFERIVHDFDFARAIYYRSFGPPGMRRTEPWPSWTVEFDQRMLGAAYVGILGDKSLRLYYGGGYAVVSGDASVSLDGEIPGLSSFQSERLMEALFGFVAGGHGSKAALDFLNSADIGGIYDLLPPDPPQPDGIYAVVGLLHMPGSGRFSWGANLEYFVEPELMNVNLLLGLRF